MPQGHRRARVGTDGDQWGLGEGCADPAELEQPYHAVTKRGYRLHDLYRVHYNDIVMTLYA